MFIGGDSKTVRVLLDSGSVSEIRLEDAVAVEFSARQPAPSPTSTPTPSLSPAAAPKPVTVPAGTALNVRLTQAIDVDVSGRTDVQGDRGRSRNDLGVGRDSAWRVGNSASRSGAVIGHDEGQRQDLSEDQLHRVWWRSYEVVTGYVEARGREEGKRGALEAGSRNAPAVPPHRRREHSTVTNWPWAESVRVWPSASRASWVSDRVDPRRHPLPEYATAPPRGRRGCVPSERRPAWRCTAAPPVWR